MTEDKKAAKQHHRMDSRTAAFCKRVGTQKLKARSRGQTETEEARSPDEEEERAPSGRSDAVVFQDR